MKHSKTFLLTLIFLIAPIGISHAENNSLHEKAGPLLVRQSELLKEKPTIDTPNGRVWNILKTELLRINLVEMKGELKLHRHPDADHSIMLLKGKVKVWAGKTEMVLNEGDLISIPKNLPHKYTVIGEKALLVSMDAPYYDPKKTIQIDQ